MQTDTAIRKWAVAKNQELHRCGDGLYVRGFLSGRKLFQVRLSVDSKRHWIDVGDYPQKSLAASREISLALKRVAKSRGASLEQIKRAALLATAVAVHLSTVQQALFALDAKTLPKTVSQLEHPQIVIAADHDDEGIASAKATGRPYALPLIRVMIGGMSMTMAAQMPFKRGYGQYKDYHKIYSAVFLWALLWIYPDVNLLLLNS